MTEKNRFFSLTMGLVPSVLAEVVLREQVKELFKAQPFTLIASLFNSCILVWILSGAEDENYWGWYWLAAMTAVLCIRAVLVWRFRQQEQPDYVLWYRLFIYGVLATGLVLGRRLNTDVFRCA